MVMDAVMRMSVRKYMYGSRRRDPRGEGPRLFIEKRLVMQHVPYYITK